MDSQGDLQEILVTQDAQEGDNCEQNIWSEDQESPLTLTTDLETGARDSHSDSVNSTGNEKVTYFDKFIYC